MNTFTPYRALFGAIALALGTVAGSAVADTRPPATPQVMDARHEAQIQASFNTNRHLRPFELSVNVDGAKAVLEGKVDEAVCKDLAEQIALGVDGIRTVDNRILVDAGYTRPHHEANHRDFGDKVEDATITASIKSKLMWNTHTDALDIHVDTDNGRVKLTGTAATNDEKSLAGRIANDTEGVSGIDNQIAIVTTPNAHERAHAASERGEQKVSDSWITTKVKSSLMFTRSIHAFDITVTTTDGVVKLDGLVDSAGERARALQVASDVRGVKRVDTSGLRLE